MISAPKELKALDHTKNLNYGLPRLTRAEAEIGYLTAAMAAERLGISLTHLYALRNNGQIKAAALRGNRLLYTMQEVDRVATLIGEQNNQSKMEKEIAGLMAKSARKNTTE
jgi:hypothetical protein